MATTFQSCHFKVGVFLRLDQLGCKKTIYLGTKVGRLYSFQVADLRGMKVSVCNDKYICFFVSVAFWSGWDLELFRIWRAQDFRLK